MVTKMVTKMRKRCNNTGFIRRAVRATAAIQPLVDIGLLNRTIPDRFTNGKKNILPAIMEKKYLFAGRS